MYDIPEIISLPHQKVFRPYLLPSTNFCRSFSNYVLLPLAPKNPPRIVKPRTSTDQKNTILKFFIPLKKPRVLRTSSP